MMEIEALSADSAYSAQWWPRMVGMDPEAKLASAGDGHWIFKWIHSLPDGPCGLSVQ
jgi:hypothetical protein